MKRTIIPFAVVAMTLSASATTYHVGASGSDSNNGRTVATAWATLQHAADVVQSGDSVVVSSGEYVGFAVMEHGGTPGDPIVFSAVGQTVSIVEPCAYNDLDGINVENVSWVVVEGFTVNGMPRTGIRSAVSDHIFLRHNTCHANGRWGILTGFVENVVIEHNTCSGSMAEHGIYFSNSSDDPIIRYNHCFDNHANGIHMNGDESMGGDGVISNAQVYGNVIHGNGVGGGSGINCDGVVNSVIHDNLLYDNHASGISLYQIDGGAPSTGNKVYNNTIVNASDARWCINITEECSGNQLLNNILVNQHAWRGSIVVAEDALAGFVSDHNLFTARLSPDGDATIMTLAAWQALGYDAHSMEAPALNTFLADAVGGDFRASSASAPQVDAGTNAVATFVTMDLDQTKRPLGAGYDIGCYEFDGSTSMAAASTSEERLTNRSGMLHIAEAPPGATLSWLDPIGRTTASGSPVQMGMDIPVPSGVSIAVLKDAAGRPLAFRKVVKP